MSENITETVEYKEKFALLNQSMRWEAADILREKYRGKANQLQSLVNPRKSFYVKYGKRAFDVTISVLALTASIPVNLVLVPLIYLDLGKPVVFKQTRIGRGGEEFTIVKLRTMRDAVDENGKLLLGELRVTPLGRFIRRTSLDELLNFWSILKGDMSVIGPRPLPPEYLCRYTDRHNQRHQMKPGLECPIVKKIDSPPTYEDQFENDVWYVENVSMRTDLMMLFKVFTSAIDSRQNAVRGSSSRGIFMGYDENGHVITSRQIPMWVLDTVLDLHGFSDHTGAKEQSEGSNEFN